MKRIAIIGSGISGLGAAYLLHPHCDITVYEKNNYLGGHSRTVNVHTPDGTVPVDTGFIVFNYRNYPNLTRLFEHLDVPVVKSDMSFGVSVNQGWLEYGTRTLGGLFAQKTNLFRLPFWQMIRQILRFNKVGKHYIDSDLTLGECLKKLGMGKWFQDYYILAMGASIWSTPLKGMLDFPASTFIRFFDNHGLLSVNDQPQWYTVKGGSREYVSRLSQPFADRIKLNCGVDKVVRNKKGVTVYDSAGGKDKYDEVIFACHSDQALALIENPTESEQRILGNIRYQSNEMVLHSDTSFMPKRKNAWASWIYLSDQESDHNPRVSLSYWMNNLQPLATKTPVIVTLNPSRQPDEKTVYDRYTFEHPVFDQPAITSQQQLAEIQGKDCIWYAGAWQRYGFHEDGLSSAVDIARAFNVEVPWTK